MPLTGLESIILEVKKRNSHAIESYPKARFTVAIQTGFLQSGMANENIMVTAVIVTDIIAGSSSIVLSRGIQSPPDNLLCLENPYATIGNAKRLDILTEAIVEALGQQIAKY